MNYRKKAMLMAGALLCLNLSIYIIENEQCIGEEGDDGTSNQEWLFFRIYSW